MGARLTAFAVVLLIASAASNAQGDIEVTGEPGRVDARSLDELVRLELGTPHEDARIVVRIDGKRAQVEVATTTGTRRGTVTLPEGQVERTLALFIGELARRPEAEPEPEPVPEPSPAPPAPPKPPAPPTPRVEAPRVHPCLLGTMGVRWVPVSGEMLATPRIEGGICFDDAIRLGVVARYAHGAGDDPLGTVRADAFTAGLTASWTFARLLATGPRFELGGAAGRGEGTNASSTTALVSTAAWELELRVHLSRSVAALFALEGGWYLRGVVLRADERDVVDLSGAFGGASIGIAYGLGRP